MIESSDTIVNIFFWETNTSSKAVESFVVHTDAHLVICETLPCLLFTILESVILNSVRKIFLANVFFQRV